MTLTHTQKSSPGTQDPHTRPASLGLLDTPSPAAEPPPRKAGPTGRTRPAAAAGAPTPPPPAGTRWAAAATAGLGGLPAPRAAAAATAKGPALPRPAGWRRPTAPAAAHQQQQQQQQQAGPGGGPHHYWKHLFEDLAGEALAEEGGATPVGGGPALPPPRWGATGPAMGSPALPSVSGAASAPTVGGEGVGERAPTSPAGSSPGASVAAPPPPPAAAALPPSTPTSPAVCGPAAHAGRITRRTAAATATAVVAAPPSPPAATPAPAAPPPLDPALAAAVALVATPSTAGTTGSTPAAAMSPELEGSASPPVALLPLEKGEGEAAAVAGVADTPASSPPPAAPPPAIETVVILDEDFPCTPVEVGLAGGGGLSPTASPPSTRGPPSSNHHPGAGGAAAAAPSALPRGGAFGLSRRMTTTAARPSLAPGVRPSLAPPALGGGRRQSLAACPRLSQPVFNAAAPAGAVRGAGPGRPAVAAPPQAFPLGPLGAARVAADAAAAGRQASVVVPVAASAPAAAPPTSFSRPASARAAPPPRALPTPGGRVLRASPAGAGEVDGPPPSSPVGDLLARLRLTPSPRGGGGGAARAGRAARPASAAAVGATAAPPPHHSLVKPEPTDFSPAGPGASPAPPPTPLPPGEALARLLALAGQDPDAAADPAGRLPSMDELLELHVGGKAAAGARAGDVVKVGEGTFGEAFRVGGSVVKVVPIDGGRGSATGAPAGDAQKSAGELLAEAEIALALTSLRTPLDRPGGGLAFGDEDGAADATTGFAHTTAVGVCYGAYAGTLVRAWRAWKGAHGSDNPDPGAAFPAAGQAFVLLFGAYGGANLEAWAPASSGEVRSVLLQATLALAVAERALQFEHRDLHWGNILIARTACGAAPPAARLAGADIALPGAAGLAVTLIDFTLSRLAAAGGGAAYCDLNADPALFAGPRGDPQAETYRRMRRAVRGDWAAHAPATNAAWLHYLADVFVSAKAPPPGAGPDEGRALRGFRRRALTAPSAGALLHDEYFEGAWVARAPRWGSA